MVSHIRDIRNRATSLIQASDHPDTRKGIANLRDGIIGDSVRYCSEWSHNDIRPVAQSLLLANPNPYHQRGVALLAWACGVRDLLEGLPPTRIITIETTCPALSGEVAP